MPAPFPAARRTAETIRQGPDYRAVPDDGPAVKKRAARRSEASPAIDRAPRAASHRKVPPPRRATTFTGVHRDNHQLCDQPVESAASRVLAVLAAGRPLVQAVAAAGPRVEPARVREWCAPRMEPGWFSRRGAERR